MTSVCKRILCYVIPVLFIIGLVRIVINGDNTFCPTPKQFLDNLYSMPDIAKMLRDAVNVINANVSTMKLAFTTISSLNEFFVAISSFFRVVADVLNLILSFIVCCFAWLGWFVKFLFGM